jgi:hypothetical protein
MPPETVYSIILFSCPSSVSYWMVHMGETKERGEEVTMQTDHEFPTSED